MKKGLNYFEDRVKDVTVNVNGILEDLEASKNDETTAAKRGWTCLCCDKGIKQYEGKMGELKFTNIFPTRYDSPRIGGYYKQKESNKDYNQLYLKHHRKVSNNGGNKSKD